MSNEPIISVSGLRGIIGETLNPVVAVNYVAAFASEIQKGPLVVSRDGRSTGPMIADAVKSAVCASGRDVLYADVASTPTTGVLVRSNKAAGGIQISASHNPPEYNGIKLFGSDGRVIGAAAGQRVLDRYRSQDFQWCPFADIGRSSLIDETTEDHLAAVLKTVDVQRIAAAKFTVLLDSNHGAGSILGQQLLSALGCQTKLLGSEPNGLFAHPPEPTAQNLKDVCSQVVVAKAAVGFCQDPDADRLALIDEQGTYIGEEYTVAIVVDNILQQMKGPVVTNCSTSRMTEDLCKKYNVPFFRAKVGEAHVCDAMIANNAVFGGEGNGGPIDPRVGYVRDSFVGMAQVLHAMAVSKQSLSQLAAKMPNYAIHKSVCRVETEEIGNCFERLQSHFSSARPDRLDGLRLDWENEWLLVRSSNTEPIVRLVAESKNLENAKRLCDEASKAMRIRD